MIAPRAASALLVALLLAGCAGTVPRPGEPADGPPARRVDPMSIPQPVPHEEPRGRYGNPDSYQVFGHTYHVLDDSRGYVARGVASWYGTKFHGRRTSSGEPYDMYKYTAAHRTLPLPTYAQVTNLENGRTVIVRINDRGPFHDNRLIDLSYIAARQLGYADQGTARVEVRAIDPARQPPLDTRLASANGPIYLQAGAFTDSANAARLKATLEKAGVGPVSVESVRVDDRLFHRVRIGPLGTPALANSLVKRILALGLEPPRLIVD